MFSSSVVCLFVFCSLLSFVFFVCIFCLPWFWFLSSVFAFFSRFGFGCLSLFGVGFRSSRHFTSVSFLWIHVVSVTTASLAVVVGGSFVVVLSHIFAKLKSMQ
jgi:hypothetical protein